MLFMRAVLKICRCNSGLLDEYCFINDVTFWKIDIVDFLKSCTCVQTEFYYHLRLSVACVVVVVRFFDISQTGAMAS